MQAIKISLYLIAFVVANLLALHFGAKGLLITALFIVPFDFVIRCTFHEAWSGRELVVKFGLLVICASLITYLINAGAKDIALGSVCAFLSAQVVAGVFYQVAINKSYFLKVNGSDFFGILVDSLIFQSVAFGVIDFNVLIVQVSLKIIGGLFWYWVIFKKLKLIK